MGDFEDVFGAGADADSIISGYADDYGKATHLEKVNWFRPASPEEEAVAIEKDDFDNWCKKVVRQGGKRGPSFSTYSEMKSWDVSNNKPHVRRRSPRGGFQIYFID